MAAELKKISEAIKKHPVAFSVGGLIALGAFLIIRQGSGQTTTTTAPQVVSDGTSNTSAPAEVPEYYPDVIPDYTIPDSEIPIHVVVDNFPNSPVPVIGDLNPVPIPTPAIPTAARAKVDPKSVIGKFLISRNVGLAAVTQKNINIANTATGRTQVDKNSVIGKWLISKNVGLQSVSQKNLDIATKATAPKVAPVVAPITNPIVGAAPFVAGAK